MRVVAWLLGGSMVTVVALSWWWAITAVVSARRSLDDRAHRQALRALLAWLLGIPLGLLATMAGLAAAFGSVSAVDPSQKARVLAQGISEAMNATAFSGMAGLLPGITAIVVLVRTRHANRGDPPPPTRVPS